MHRVAAMIYGSENHYIDHLAPLCSLLDIPLIVTEQESYDLLSIFYKNLTVIIKEPFSIASYIAENYDIIFCCTARALFDEIFFFQQTLLNKKIHTIWCPHGNSDKGHSSLFMEGLKGESAALVYGQKMIDFFKEKKILDTLKRVATVGNYRKRYFLHHKPFYDDLVKTKIQKRLAVKKKNILFAPTWYDIEKSSSCFDILPILIDKLPEDFNLIIKLHPNIYLQEPSKVEKLKLEIEERSEILLLEDFPPIYPILDFIDIYLGDASSIGYDFITLNKPMFLLNQNARDSQKDPGMYLFRCAVEIKKDQYHDIFKIIKAYLPSDRSYFTDVRKEVERYTFDEDLPLEEWKKNIFQLFSTFPDEEINFF